MKFGIIGKKDKEEVYELTAKLSKWLEERNCEVFIETGLAKKIGFKKGTRESQIPKKVDIVIVLGGDGTFLGVARLVNEYSIPIIGINLGGLGFLTEFTVRETFTMMESVIKGEYEVEDREMISTTIYKKGKKLDDYLVLNDLVINNGPISRIVDLAVYIDGTKITTFKADGIIFSTPTGSTAYSLSAGGPIVYPTLPVIVITPICPHILTNRPLVVSSNTEIKIKVLTEAQHTYVTLDGQIGITLDLNDEIVLKGSSTKVKLIKSPYRDYFNILKTKLMWGERYGSING